MRDGKLPLFRKVVVPWYDSDAACYIVIAAMIAVIVFGIGGVSVARTQEAYQAYIWVPIVLIVLGAAVLISTAVRLIRRYMMR